MERTDMIYDVINVLKQTEKSTVQLVKEQDREQLFIRKTLQGKHLVYQLLQELEHPYLPAIYEVSFDGDMTTVIEEYIEGETVGEAGLSDKQCRVIVRELCDVLILLHDKGIIHRDIKPSNILLAKDGHIRLIDFDAARMPKEDAEQDTMLLGTRGYAPPEQYGFAQTDERADIYALGVTVKQILGDRAGKARYRRCLSKCTNLDPDKRYRDVRQVKKAFFGGPGWAAGVLCAAALIAALILWNALSGNMLHQDASPSEETELIVLPVPADPHWDGETGSGLWGCVFESGTSGEQKYDWKLYRRDTETPPDPERDEWDREGTMRGNVAWNRDGLSEAENAEEAYFMMSFVDEFWENGFYYFAVRASGDGTAYSDSTYVLSDAFEFTGMNAPPLPAPEGLCWTAKETAESRWYFGAFTNWDDYADKDTFDMWVYDEDGEYVMNTMVFKKFLVDKGWPGVRIMQAFVDEPGKTYRFAIQVHSSRPNEYRSSPSVNPCPEEEYLSPPLKVQNPLKRSE